MTKHDGTAMPVKTHSDLWQMEVMGLGEKPTLREGKVTRDGELTYASGCLLRVLRKDGTVKVDKSASVHVTKPAAMYEAGVTYRAQGRIFVQPYQSGEGASARLALSITVEELVPAESLAGRSKPTASKPADGQGA